MMTSRLNGRIANLEKALNPPPAPRVVLAYVPDGTPDREQKLAEARRQAGPGGTVLAYTGNIDPDLL